MDEREAMNRRFTNRLCGRRAIATALCIIMVACAMAFITFAYRSQQPSLSTESQAVVEPPIPIKEVEVDRPGQLDWTFTFGQESLTVVDTEKSRDRTRYVVIVPDDFDPESSAPPRAVVLFVSATPEPVGTEQWGPLCRKHGLLFACPIGAGNECPTPQRARIVLDVLADLRRKHHVVPERTYLSGVSGGARLASMVAFALPEYFGGVLAACAGVEPREEPWLRRRMVDRLSVALITGEHDINRTEVELYRGPMLAALGVRTKVWNIAGMAHTIPPTNAFDQAFQWLEADREKRLAEALKWPAMSVPASEAISRDDWSQLLLNEARSRASSPVTKLSGIEQLEGITARWPDLAAATEAKELLDEFAQQDVRPWESERQQSEIRSFVAEARAYDAFATGPLPHEYLDRRWSLVQQAIANWSKVIIALATSPDPTLSEEASNRIKELSNVLSRSSER